MIRTRQEHWYALILSIIVLLGFVLRLFAAQGGLWLDEAWSAQMASEAGTPLGIFLNINHDNNHHLNSLWLQFVGFGAPPMLSRAMSIVAGTLSILVAARIVRSRGPIFGLVAALVFAISPMLVTMGSEARGYAPMALALLAAIVLANDRVMGLPGDRVRFRLALCFALGALCQLTIVFGFVALIGWVFFDFARRTTVSGAASQTLQLFAPALGALAIVIALVFGAAYSSPAGFRIGSYEPFTWPSYLRALIEMIGFSVGYPIVTPWLLIGVSILVIVAQRILTTRIWLYRLAVIGFPIMVAVLQLGNPGYPRYYLVAAIALLLLISEMIATAVTLTGWARSIGIVALGGFAAGSLAQDADLIQNQRGDPDAAVREMRSRAPKGARVLVDRPSATALLEYSAAHLSYPLVVESAQCEDARFLFLDRIRGEDFPHKVAQCGWHYTLIGGARAHGLSGTHWNLYERRSE